jgi:hypothetical protein
MINPTPTAVEIVPLDNAREVVRMSEAYIDATLRLSLASDSRAMQLSGITAAASTALLVFGLNNINKASPPGDLLATASFTASALFFASSLFALSVASPKAMGVAGTTYDNWSKDELTGDLVTPLLSQARVYAKQANENLMVLKRNAKRTRFALAILGATPIVAAASAWLRYIY